MAVDSARVEFTTATAEGDDRCTCILGVHDDTLLAEDVVFDPTALSGFDFREGTLLKIEPNTTHAASHEPIEARVYDFGFPSRNAGKARKRHEARRLLFIARNPAKDPTLKASNVQVWKCCYRL